MYRWISHQVSRGSLLRIARSETTPMTHMMPRPTVAVSTSGYLVSRTAT